MEEQTKENAIAIKYNKDFYVIQANELVRSKQDDLTLLEAKLIRLAITQVLRDDTDLKTYSCNVVDLANFLGIDNHNIYRDIQELSKSLMKKSIFIKDKTQPKRKGKENYRIFHWIDYVDYTDGVITFKLSDSLKPYLIGLEQLFTLYGYDAVIGLPTNYSIRLYELIASYQNMTVRLMPDTNYTDIPIEKNEFIFTIDWLRDYFNCNDKYPNTGDFVKRVIDGAVKAIVKNTLMRLSYRTVKKGRSITHIVFKLNEWTNQDFTDYVKQLRGWDKENG
jgi:plasmid replication initiation protein